ncbi:MAG: isoleucine--tRNA ligase [bacterium]
MDYKTTLNLPKTDFPMKANLSQREPLFLAKWDKMDIYNKIKQKSEEDPQFILHDGPPYPNGNIHMGHALNKILKDLIIKSKTMSGHQAHYIPGWDCHGLPIEHKVEQELTEKKASITVHEVRAKCREYALKYVEIQKREFKRLGVFGEWDRPYLTADPRYEATIIREFAKFIKTESVYKGYKPVHWCASCQTALAEAEVEYEDHRSFSIYVRFKISSDYNDLWPDLIGKSIYILIWTTTPWTLPANLAVAVHPDIEYGIFQYEDAYYIMATKMAENVSSVLEYPFSSPQYVFTGVKIEGLSFRHPFIERNSQVICAPFVTLEQGSGCVHIAPGHGQEDYEIGLKYGLEVFTPVDGEGKFTAEAGDLEGLNVFKANDVIIKRMEENASLIKKELMTHSYPHCWRCKKPIIFRATEQWFISMEKNHLRKKALEEIKKTMWIPAWGENRITGMIQDRPDWCISRQRFWGVPLIIFYCSACRYTLMDADVIEHIAQQVADNGMDIWFQKSSEELLPAGIRCPECGNGEFAKEMDIIDVWFESGVSHAAVLEHYEDMRWPADLYLEGSDQHRGWFHSSLLTAVNNRGSAPYKGILTHGFVVDGEGKKMSKSAGNVISPQEVITKYGAEIIRIWVAAQDYREDMRVCEEILKRLAESYRRIRNTCRFILGNLNDFNSNEDTIPYEERDELDQWVLHQLQKLKSTILKAYQDYQFHLVFYWLHNFCAVTLSALYLDASKDRLYTSKPHEKTRKSAQSTMNDILHALVRLMAPIMSFTAEEIWDHIPSESRQGIQSIHLCSFPEVNETFQNDVLNERWEKLLGIRADIAKSLESARSKKIIGHPLDAKVSLCLGENKELFEFLNPYQEELKTILIISDLEILSGKTAFQEWEQSATYENLWIKVEKAQGQKCERCWKYSTTVGQNKDHISLCDRCATKIV